MFDVGLGEALVLGVLALVIFGERLPKVAAQAGRALRELRRMATSAKDDLRAGLGPEFADMDLADLHPRRFVRKHLFEEDFEEGSRAATNTGTLSGISHGERPPFDREAT